MNMVPVQNVIPGAIEPVPVLASILSCLVGDQQPFAFLTNASHDNDSCCWIVEPKPPSKKGYRLKRGNMRFIIFPLFVIKIPHLTGVAAQWCRVGRPFGCACYPNQYCFHAFAISVMY
jgi:hypothetical protein